MPLPFPHLSTGSIPLVGPGWRRQTDQPTQALDRHPGHPGRCHQAEWPVYPV